MLHASGELANSPKLFLNTCGAFSPCICTQTVRYTKCMSVCMMHLLVILLTQLLVLSLNDSAEFYFATRFRSQKQHSRSELR